MRHPDRVIPYADERWYQLLHQACAASSVTAVAEKLGYKRARISQVLNGIQPKGSTPDKVATEVLKIYDRWECPYMQTEITGEDCRETHSAPTPAHDPARLAQRRMCKTCKHRYTFRVRGGNDHE